MTFFTELKILVVELEIIYYKNKITNLKIDGYDFVES